MVIGHRMLRLGATFLFPVLAAAALCQGAKTQSPDAAKEADRAFRAGYAARQAGQLEVARARFAEAVRLLPKIAESHEALGVVLLEMGKAKEAIPELTTANRLKPDDLNVETNLALAHAQAGEPDKAIAHFEATLRLAEAAKRTPLEASFYDSYARALAAAGKRTEALEQLLVEERLGVQRADLEDSIGSIHAQLGQWGEAESAFERALAADPAYEPALIHLGVVLRQKQDLAKSLETLETATRSETPDAAAFVEYARSLAAAGQDEAAVAAFEEAMKLNPQLPGGAMDLAMSLQRIGRQQDAIPWFEKDLSIDPDNTTVLTNLALAMTLTGKAKESLAYIERAYALSPKDPEILKNRGVVHLQVAALDEAIADFEAGIKLNAKDPQMHYDLGLAYKLKDRMDESIAELRRAGEMDPELEDPPYTLGITYMQLGKLDEAVAQLRKAVALRADNGSAWAILGSTLKQDGRLDEAAEALEKAIPLQPGQPGPRVTLAGVLAEQAGNLAPQAEAAEAAGNTEKAEQIRKQIKTLRERATDYRREGAELSRAAVSRQRASFAMNAGNQLLLRGQIADAVSRYQESIAADGTFAEPHTQLAIAYDRQGRAPEAAAERAKAAELSKGK